jgi:hypothetical protein
MLVGGLKLSGAELARAESDARGNLIAAWSGLALGIAAVGTYLTYRLSRRGQVTDRFGKAIDQLGNESLAVQTGGLYALEQIVKDSRELHWPVMEAVFGYLADRAPWRSEGDGAGPYDGADEEELQKRVKRLTMPANVQAAVTIIGRRDPTYDRDGGVINLKGLDLGDARLDGARLAAHSPNLDKVNLRRTHLAGAHLRRAHLAGADLSEAVLFDANLQGADLTGARMHRTDLGYANLKGVNLEGADLTGATGLGSAKLEGVRWNAATTWPSEDVPAEVQPSRVDRLQDSVSG